MGYHTCRFSLLLLFIVKKFKYGCYDVLKVLESFGNCKTNCPICKTSLTGKFFLLINESLATSTSSIDNLGYYMFHFILVLISHSINFQM